MVSLQAQIDELGKQIASESAQMSSGRNNTLLADYRASPVGRACAPGARQSAQGRGPQPARAQHPVQHPAARGGHQPQPLRRACSSAIRRSASPAASARPRCRSSTAPTPPALPYKPNLLMNLLFGLAGGLLAGIAAAIGLEFAQRHDQDSRGRPQQARPRLPRSGSEDDRKGHLRRGAEEPGVAGVRSLFGGGRGAAIQHRIGNAQDPAHHQHPAGRGQIVDCARACPEFRPPREEGAADRRRPSEAGVQGGVGQDRPDQAAYQRGSCRPCTWSRPSIRTCGCCPAARSRPTPPTCCRPARFRTILAEAAERFDLVIVDAPPTLGLADAPLLAAAAGRP